MMALCPFFAGLLPFLSVLERRDVFMAPEGANEAGGTFESHLLGDDVHGKPAAVS